MRIEKIFLSSPNDTEAEMNGLTECIDEWNTNHSDSYGIYFKKIDWRNRASSQMGAHPQEIINLQALSECDYLIIVFKFRFGTKTDKYLSGTEHEYEWFKENKRSAAISIYFSSEAPPELNPQYQLVVDFKQRIETGGTGLYETFDSVNSLQKKIEKRLSYIARNFKISEAGRGVDSKTKFDFVKDFFNSREADAKALCSNKNINNQSVADWYFKTLDGLKTALKEEHATFFMKFHQGNAMAFRSQDNPTSTIVTGCQKFIEDCLRTLNSIKSTITPADLAQHLEVGDLKNYNYPRESSAGLSLEKLPETSSEAFEHFLEYIIRKFGIIKAKPDKDWEEINKLIMEIQPPLVQTMKDGQRYTSDLLRHQPRLEDGLEALVNYYILKLTDLKNSCTSAILLNIPPRDFKKFEK